MTNYRPESGAIKPVELSIPGIEHEKSDAEYFNELQQTGLNIEELSVLLLTSRPTITKWANALKPDFALTPNAFRLAQAGDFVIRAAKTHDLSKPKVGQALKTLALVKELRSGQQYCTEAYRIFPYAPSETEEALQPTLNALHDGTS